MKIQQRVLLVSAIAAFTFFAGCNRNGLSSNESHPAAVDAAAIARADAQISQPAWLSKRLPEHTVAYARIPSLWGTLSAPDGRPLDAAFANERHAKVIADLRKAASTEPLLAQAEGGAVVQLLLGDQAAPIEVAVIDASDGVSPFSRVLVTTILDVPDVASLNTRITALAAGQPSPLQAPFDANGDAVLQKYGALHFDAKAHRLFLSVGTTASALTLQQDIAQLKAEHPHPMQDDEREIDSSGQGLFVWLSAKGINNTLAAQLHDAPPDGVLHDAIERAQSVALGWGTVNGHGRLRLQIRAPQSRLLGYLATDAGTIDLKSSGKPDWVVTIASPGAQNLQSIHDNLERDFGVGVRTQIDSVLSTIQAKTGMDPLASANLVGPQKVLFADANGTYFAISMRDRAALYAKLDELAKRFGWRNSVVKIGGAQIHELDINGLNASLTQAANQPGMNSKTAAWMKLYSRAGSHLYWVEDGNYLVFAKVPQALVDRAASSPDTSIGDWLRTSQSYDSAHTLIGFAATTRNMQREVYYTYLGLLQSAGDILGQPNDLTQLPSASQLHLPVEGAAGIALEANDQRLALQVTYEQSPAELVGQGGSMTTVAVVAILAAIAIPAYQDYVIRSQVSEGMMLANGAKVAVAEYYANNGRMPRDNAQAGLAAPDQISGNYTSSVTITDGKIIVAYEEPKANPKLRGSSVLVLMPQSQGTTIHWTCDTAAGTTIGIKYLPAACRP